MYNKEKKASRELHMDGKTYIQIQINWYKMQQDAAIQFLLMNFIFSIAVYTEDL